MKRLSRIATVGLVLLSVVLSGCMAKKDAPTTTPAPAAKETTAAPALEDKVVVYSPHGKDMLEELANMFQAKYPNVKVEWLFLGSQEVMDRIRSEKANAQADIWFGGPSNMFMQGKEEGLLEPYKPTWSDKVAADFKDAQDYWYATFQTPTCIMYNNEKVKPEDAPKDWKDLADPKWKDKVLIRYPMASGTMRTIYAAMIWNYYINDKKPDAGYDFLRKLDANTKEYVNDSTLVYQKIARGEALVTVWNVPDTITNRDKNKYPFSFVIPESGVPIISDGLGIVKGAKHPNAAKAYYEFITSPEVAKLLADKYVRIPVRNDVPDLPQWMKSPVKAMNIDWLQFGKLQPDWLKYWDESIKGKGAK